MLAFWIQGTGYSQSGTTVEPVRTAITVTERVSTDAPANITILGAPEIQETPGVNLDDRLRQVPGFSLFRRSSSLAANPTTQGVSLRGLGSTGASRTVVLWDGVPLNSPFGGWIYWTRVIPDSLERIEVSRGASTSVFGDKALGGAIGLFSRQTQTLHGWLGWDSGNVDTRQLEGGGSLPLGSHWAVSGTGRGFTTDGYYIVPAPPRGPVDTRANVRFAGGTARGDYFNDRQRLFLRADILSEERDNGTQLTFNSTGLGTAALNYSREFGSSTLNGLAFHSREEYRATFSSISADRQTERLTSRQSVPAEATGAAGMWRSTGRRWNFLAGGDYLRSEGYSRDTLYPTGYRVSGGVLSQGGLFGQADASFGRARLFGGFRGQNAGNGDMFWMPSGGIQIGLENWRLRGSGYRAFRAPTLNELYRDFRAGNSVTLANPALKPEALTGVEAGADYVRGFLRISATAFHNSLDGLITNVTRSVTPNLITRQRDNAGAATVQGVEASVERRWSGWTAEASWLLADSRYATGERVPQAPKNQGSALLTWSRKGTLITGGLRASSLQFEDDRNQFVLPGYAVLQFTMRQQMGHGVSAVMAIENSLDRTYAVGYSPTPLIGAPRLWRAGLRWASR